MTADGKTSSGFKVLIPAPRSAALRLAQLAADELNELDTPAEQRECLDVLFSLLDDFKEKLDGQ